MTDYQFCGCKGTVHDHDCWTLKPASGWMQTSDHSVSRVQPVPETDDQMRERVAAALRPILEEWGLHTTANQSYHGWRCQHPDRYGPCDCFDELMSDLPGSLLAALAADNLTITTTEAARTGEAHR